MILMAALSGAALGAIMALAWCIRQRTGQSGWIDVFWSLGVGGVGLAAALWPFDAEWHWRQFAVGAVATVWCLRLGLHIAARTRPSTSDDPRYRHLIDQWGSDAPRRLFWFVQSQAAVGLVLVLAVALAAHNPAPQWRIQDLIGLGILALAVAGEAAADRQLRAFRRDPANRGRVYDTGLWRWSRHPNYFFEWLAWTAYPIVAVSLGGAYPLGWLALAAPAAMYWVLVHVSGIPPLEAHMLRSRGDAFRAYQARTRAFFPIPLKR